MPAAVVCALVPSPAPLVEALQSEPLAVAAPGDLAAVLELAARGPEHVVLVGEARNQSATLRAAAVLTDKGHRVAVRHLPHGPAATVLIAREAANVNADAATVPALVDSLAAGAWSGAWVPKVSHLSDPQPTLGQHARSFLPSRRGFVVSLTGMNGPRVVRSGRVRVSGPATRTVVGVTPGSLPGAARADLVKASRAHELVDLAWLTTDVAERFGHRGAIEGAALGADGRTAAATLTPTSEPCRECGVWLYTPACPFCHVVPAGRTHTVSGGAL